MHRRPALACNDGHDFGLLPTAVRPCDGGHCRAEGIGYKRTFTARIGPPLQGQTIIMRASTLCFRSAVCLGIVGILIGIAMAASHNHAVMPAHAHLNLLGWVALFLMGFFYRLHPALDASRMALVQTGVWILGTVVLVAAVAAIHLGQPAAEPAAAIGSLIVLAAMAMFAWLVFRAEPSRAAVGAMRPAE